MRTKKGRKSGEKVYSITSAKRALSEDLHARSMRYLFSMGVRTVCFILMFVFDGPLRWVFAVGAIFIPYIAVMVANAGRETDQESIPAAFIRPSHSEVQLYDPETEFLR